MQNRYAFVGGNSGKWRVTSMSPSRGDSLPSVDFVDVRPAVEEAIGGDAAVPVGGWVLHGLISNLRYATAAEVTTLRTNQEGLGRSHARLAALIPMKKSADWWALAQDQRRAIFEEQSHHTAIGVTYLPAVARQLYHSRDLGQPFDFLTWFEFTPEHAEAFEDLVRRLRATTEWRYVEREVDIRLERQVG